jgi:hypothetical protein
MKLNQAGRILAPLLILAVIFLSLITAMGLFSSSSQSPKSNSSEATSVASVTTLTSLVSSAGQSSTGSATIAGSFGINPENCGSDCTINVQWASIYASYRTLGALEADSGAVLVGTVTSLSTVAVKGVPVTVYNMTISSTIVGPTQLSPGTNLTVAQVGGTAGGKTITLEGYPPLSIGSTDVFFLGYGSRIVGGGSPGQTATVIADPMSPYISGVADGLALVTTGGPQGLFSVQEGKVYSLDNLYPQNDAWLQVKASGVPLAQFIQEIQSAVGTTTTTTSVSSSPTTTTSTVTSSTKVP